MARTLEQITAAVRAEFPDPPGFPVRVAKQDGYLTGAEYEARLAERAQMIRQQELAEDAENADRTEREMLRATAEALQADIDLLAGNDPLTARQQRDMLARTDRILLGLGRVLVKRGVI